jgi:hypothetical protein
MIDDFVAASPTLEKATSAQVIIEGTLTTSGIPLNSEKKIDPCTSVVFKGILINSESMTICVNPSSAQLFLESLRVYTHILESGQDLSLPIRRHLAGVLEGWAQVCQAGKTHVASVWKYLKYGSDLWQVCRDQLLIDLDYWRAQATVWATGDSAGCYPIVNVHTLASTPEAVRIVVTDWSGKDGIGGFHGRLTDPDPEWYSIAEATSDSSSAGELKGFLHVLRLYHRRSIESSCPLSSSSPDKIRLVVWVSDSQSACHAINSGRTHSYGETEAVLHEIFSIAATLELSLLATWTPRVANKISDDLSHYAASLNVSEISGRFSQLPTYITGAGGFPVEQ